MLRQLNLDVPVFDVGKLRNGVVRRWDDGMWRGVV